MRTDARTRPCLLHRQCSSAPPETHWIALLCHHALLAGIAEDLARPTTLASCLHTVHLHCGSTMAVQAQQVAAALQWLLARAKQIAMSNAHHLFFREVDVKLLVCVSRLDEHFRLQGARSSKHPA